MPKFHVDLDNSFSPDCCSQTVKPGVPPNAGFFIEGAYEEIGMARPESKSTARRKAKTEKLPFTKVNYQIIAAALVCIAAGYYALAQEPWDGFLPLVVAPILLVLGYCVLVPFGILYRGKAEKQIASPSTE